MKVKFWRLPTYIDTRGSLAVMEWNMLPFRPKRAYFLFNTKAKRGGHAHRMEHEVFICMSGSFRSRVHDGKKWKTFLLKTPGQALYTSNMVWHEFDQFSHAAIMLALSSTAYKGQKGYVTDFKEFTSLCKKKS